LPRQVVPAERVHIPGRATGRADLPHPALGQDITLAHATPSAVPEHFAKFDRLSNLRVLTASCVGPELRPLSSTGVTRLPRYYRPLRHPRAPDPSLTGDRLLIAEHTLGFPVLRALSLCTCCRQYPGAAAGIIASALAPPAHVSLPRFGERVGPRIVLFEACSAFTRVTACTLATSPNFVTRWSPKASTASLPPQLLRLLPAGAFRRVGLSPTGKRRLSTAHPDNRRSEVLGQSVGQPRDHA